MSAGPEEPTDAVGTAELASTPDRTAPEPTFVSPPPSGHGGTPLSGRPLETPPAAADTPTGSPDSTSGFDGDSTGPVYDPPATAAAGPTHPASEVSDPDGAGSSTGIGTKAGTKAGSNEGADPREVRPWTPRPVEPGLVAEADAAAAHTEDGPSSADPPASSSSDEPEAATSGDQATPAGAAATNQTGNVATHAADRQAAPAAVAAPTADGAEVTALHAEVADLRGQLSSLTGILEQVLAGVEEIGRLRRRDTELADRLHSDVTKLRAGEVAQAITPVVLGMLRVHDQMVSLGAAHDANSVAGLLHGQLLQSLELTAGVKPFTPTAGETFDPKIHTGVRRVPTSDPTADGTIAKTVKAGFTRADGSIVRTAEVEVHRLSA